MPSNNVYQPTTVSYEQRGDLLSQTTASNSLKVLKHPVPQFTILIFGLLLFASGIAMIASGAADYSDTEAHIEDIADDSEGMDIGLIVGGAFATLFGVCLLGIFSSLWLLNYLYI